MIVMIGLMRFRARRLVAPGMVVLAAVLSLMVWATSVRAASQGPNFAGTVLACTFSVCGPVTVGNPDGLCSVSAAPPQHIDLGTYNFSIPPTALINGIVVRPKLGREAGSAPVQLLKNGSVVGTSKNAVGPITTTCANTTEVVGLGGDSDLWGTTWTPAEVNTALGVQVRATTQITTLDSVSITVFFTDQIALGTDAQRCVNTMNTDGVAVGAAQGAVAVDCLKAAQAGHESNAQSCLLNDDHDKVAKASAKTVANAAAAYCSPTPGFGFTSAAAVNSAAVARRVGLVADIFGSNLTTAVIPTASNKAGASCQASVLGSVKSVVNAYTKAFLGCKKASLSDTDDPALSAADLQDCFAEVQSDPKDAIGKTVASLSKTVAAKCKNLSLSSVFPGHCAPAATPGSFAACVTDRVACRVCQFFNAADGLSEDCDLFDDGLTNSSCN